MAEQAEVKYHKLQEILKGLKSVVVAYSGGVDSSFLLKASIDTLGVENVTACIAVSPSLSKFQYQQALACAEDIGVKVVEIQLDELSDSKYAANKADRCFHCKSHLFAALKTLAEQKGVEHITCGSNVDDKEDFRPGSKAAEVFKIRTPLVEANLTKKDIRRLSRKLRLRTADVPASPCLATRIPYGLGITEGRLRQIEKAEEFLRGLGLAEFRVRHHDQIARIEVQLEDLDKLTKEPNRSRIIEELKKLGFNYVTIDLQGFRSGSLNESISESEKQKNL